MTYRILATTTTTVADTVESPTVTPREAWEERRRRLRETGTLHTADADTLTLIWDESIDDEVTQHIVLRYEAADQ